MKREKWEEMARRYKGTLEEIARIKHVGIERENGERVRPNIRRDRGDER